MPNSPPAVPKITLSFTTRGACVRALSLLVVGHLGLPHELAALGVDGQQIPHEEGVPQNPPPSIRKTTTESARGRVTVSEFPKARPVAASRANTLLGGLGNVHDAIDNQRRQLKLLRRPGTGRPIGLQGSLLFQELPTRSRAEGPTAVLNNCDCRMRVPW
jgi:hypothetical protein